MDARVKPAHDGEDNHRTALGFAYAVDYRLPRKVTPRTLKCALNPNSSTKRRSPS